jgi:hypothetical protein
MRGKEQTVSSKKMVASNPSLRPLEVLSGWWEAEIRWSPVGGPPTVRAVARFD